MVRGEDGAGGCQVRRFEQDQPAQTVIGRSFEHRTQQYAVWLLVLHDEDDGGSCRQRDASGTA